MKLLGYVTANDIDFLGKFPSAGLPVRASSPASGPVKQLGARQSQMVTRADTACEVRHRRRPSNPNNYEVGLRLGVCPSLWL